MFDRFNRKLNYLRISVTDRCNLRCTYCMPEKGIKLFRHEEILTFDEITGFTKVAVANGVTKIRITGGEPLVRKRVNISLDTIDPEKFKVITRNGNINDVFEGINAAKEAGLFPVKINCVVKDSKEEEEAKAVARFCIDNNLKIRYIRQMDLVRGHFSIVDGGTGGDCSSCNRLRLTSNGKLKPCLFSNIEFDIRELGFEKAINLAAELKPECGSKNETGTFYNIGG